MSKRLTHEEHLAQSLQDPEFRRLWEKSAVGRALGLWLLGYRLERNLELDELAAQIGLDVDTLAELEAGDEDPPAATLVWLAEALATPMVLIVERGLPGEKATRMVIGPSDPSSKAA
ncbi:MAG: helix-turn-helix transcriptional regulator [Armatimonadetes bacterium]|nr:helix-turn-helix transcriptional regulator [Armatimonadota bacterium]